MSRVRYGLVFLITLFTLAGCVGSLLPKGSITYRGKLVDQVTGKPVEGAVVIASWHEFTPDYNLPAFHQGGGMNYSCYKLVNVVSTVSGPDGSFELPGWVGKPAHCQSMSLGQPHVVYYKPGYSTIAMDQGEEGSYLPGSNFTVSGSDRGVTQLTPLGTHSYGSGDNHVRNFLKYVWAIDSILEQDRDGPCFWKEASPALLMALQERRRLARYMPEERDSASFAFMGHTFPHINGQCQDSAAAMAGLERQAQAIQPEEPALLPYVLSGGTASAPPQELAGYLQEEKAPGHADDRKAVIYHVDLNPANPYFLAVLAVGTAYGDAGMPGVASPPDPQKLAEQGVYGMTCPAYGEAPRAQPVAQPPVEYLYGSNGAIAMVAPSEAPVQRKAALPPRTVLDRHCRWTVALDNTKIFDSDRIHAVGERRDTFDVTSDTWTLTQRSLVRARESAPEILELHGQGPFEVFTTLEPAGATRWYLPPPGQPFILTVANAAAAVDSDDACTHLLPVSLRLKLARDYRGFRLQRLSDKPGSTACPDLVSGDFDGIGATSYAFHLSDTYAIQKLVVAKPQGADWSITTLLNARCLGLKSCVLRPLAPGIYKKGTREWLDPDGMHQYPITYLGQPASLDAPNPGFLEIWNQPVADAYFFRNGAWQALTVNAPPK